MSGIYVQGYGLVCSLGTSPEAALTRLDVPAPTAMRLQTGIDAPLPYYAIPQIEALVETSWFERCCHWLSKVIEQSGAPADVPLYLASSSLNAGAYEAGEPHATCLPEFLDELGRALDWQAPLYWVNTACTSAFSALLMVRDSLESSSQNGALVIGLELDNQLTRAGFAAMQLLSPDAARPFSLQRNGLVLGEAVAALYIARQPARWQLCGGAQVIDCSQPSGGSEPAYRLMLQQTLAQSGWTAGEVDLIKVQAAGSTVNDEIEARALKAEFATLPALLSLKPWLGHTLGASGAAELALLLALLEHAVWPQWLPDAGSLLPLSGGAPQQTRRLIACLLGFGGSHCSLALMDTLAGYE